MRVTVPKFLWVVGIEGSGHHLIRDVLRAVLRRSEVIDKGPHYPLLLQRWDSEQVPLPRGAVRQTFKDLFATYMSSGITTIFEDTSFPYGNVEAGYEKFSSRGIHRGPLRTPDMLDFVEVMNDCANLRILVLYRSPMLTVASALRRGFSAKPQFECRLAEAVHLQIASQLGCLPVSCYRTIHFERFVQCPELYAEALADWFMISADDVRQGITAIREAGSIHDIPQGFFRVLESFFTDKRVAQWQPAYQTNPLVK